MDYFYSVTVTSSGWYMPDREGIFRDRRNIKLLFSGQKKIYRLVCVSFLLFQIQEHLKWFYLSGMHYFLPRAGSSLVFKRSNISAVKSVPLRELFEAVGASIEPFLTFYTPGFPLKSFNS